MAWSKSLDQNFKLQREENKKQAEAKQVQQTKKKQNTFYGDYRSKQQSDNTQNTQGNTFQRAVSENPFTPVKTKLYQSYQDRKKSGNVFTPTTVLGSLRKSNSAFTNNPIYGARYREKEQRENNTMEWFQSKYGNGNDLNSQIVNIPITDQKNITLRYGTAAAIDEIINDKSEKNKYKRADKIDKMIEAMGLEPEELKNAKSYAGLRKLSFISSETGKNSALKEITQPAAKFIKGLYDAGDSASRFMIKDGFKLNGEYSKELSETEKYYRENPDALGNDLLGDRTWLDTVSKEYLTNLEIDKALEWYNDTNKVTRFISDAGFESAGQMLGAYGMAGVTGLSDATQALGNIASNAATATKAGSAISKVTSISPKVAKITDVGLKGKVANAAIDKINGLSIGAAAKFLNPVDNPTTALMGIGAAQDKYDQLKYEGYDEKTARENAALTGYVNAVGEKMGYNGKFPINNSFFQYLMNNVGEAGEEVLTGWLERAVDRATGVGYVDENGDIQQRKLVGKEGIIDAANMMENATGGFVGGFVMGAPNQLRQAHNAYNTTVNEGRLAKSLGETQNIIERGIDRDNKTSAYKYADKLQSKQAAGKDISDWNVGQQIQKNDKALDGENRLANTYEGLTGIPNEAVESIENDANGRFIPNEKVEISKHRDTSYPETLRHEYGVHAIKQQAPEQFKKFEDYVNSVVRFSDNIPYESAVQREEVAALVLEKMNITAPMLEKIANGDITLADKTKIIDGINKASAKLKDKLGKTQSLRFGGEISNEHMLKAFKLYKDVIRTAAQNKSQNSMSDVSSSMASDVKYSPIETNSKGKYVQADRQVINSENPAEWEGQIYNYINDKIRNGQDVIIPTEDGDNLTISEKTAWKMGYRNRVLENGIERPYNNNEYLTKINAAAHIDELAEISKRGKKNVPDTKNHGFAQDGFNYRTAYFRDLDGQYYRLTISVGENSEHNTVYNIGRIEKALFPDSGSKTNSNNAVHGEQSFRRVSPAGVSSALLSDVTPYVKRGNSTSNIISNNKPDVKYSFAGKKAKTADIATLEKAQALENSGMSNEDIRTQTGWSKGLDGQWKFEIDDSNAEYLGIHSLKDKFGHAEAPLYQVLKHDKLFKAYPSIKNISVHEWWNIEGNGFYSPLHDDIWVNDSIGLSNEEKLATLLHEVQHAIQMRENFAIGADTKGYGDDYYKSAGEIEARDVKQRINMSEKERKQNFPESMKPREDTIVEPADDFIKRMPSVKNINDAWYDITSNDLLSEETQERFAENVDKVFSGEMPQRTVITVGNTPKLLQEYGASDVPITINQSTMYKIAYPTGYFGAEKQGHNLGIPALKQLPKQIADPMAILKSNSKDGSRVLLTEWEDTHGNPVIIPLHLDKDGIIGISNEVASAYGKQNIETLFVDELGQSNVLYTKNNEDIHQTLQTRLQLPGVVSDDTLVKYNISNSEDNVKYSLKEMDKVSKLYENTMQKDAYTDEFKTEAERRKPEFMYEGITNKETYTAAQSDIKSRGDNTVLSELSMKDKGWTADDTAKSLALMAKYQTEGDVEKAVDVASMLRDKMTKAGQAVQALKIVNKLTPEGQFIDFTRQAENMVNNQIEKHPARDKIRSELKLAEKSDREIKNSDDAEISADKSRKDNILDKYKIEHLSENDMRAVSEGLMQLDSLNSKNDLIELILKQSKERKTASHALVKKALEGQDISFLKDTATMQMFGKIADKMPTTFAKKASAYQAMSHLLNARTMARNIVSNTAFNTVDRISTNIGSIVDCLMGVFSKQRTVGTDKGVFEKGRFKASADRAVKQYLDIALAVNHDTDSSKYNLNSTRRTFKDRTMGGLERAMSYGLQVTDEWSKGGIEYNIKKSLEGLKNNGFTADEIDRIAKYEAKYRTFQDDTKLSQVLSGLKDTLNVIGFGDTQMKGRLKTHEFGLGDLVQKYTQVPGALITRSIEYSPLGYCKALYHIGQAANNARKGASFSSQAQRNIALSLGRAMTGTGLIALFAGLSHLGIFTGEREEDSKLKAIENAEGVSNTQLNLSALSRLITNGDAGGRENGDVLTSLGFLEPLNTLMAMGNAIVEKGNVKNPVDWTKAAGAKTFDQIMDMSTMSTIRSISNTLQYGGGGTDVAIGVISDSATGFVPSPIRQIGSFFDTVQRNPYNEKDELTRARERFKATLPVAREDVAAKITPFGEEKTTTSGNRLIDFANNFFAPGNINIYQTNDISEELYRLSEISTDVLPHVPAKSFTVDKVQFKPRGKEYEKYSRLVGTITADKMRDIINSGDYKNMSDDEKVQALSDAAAEGEKEAKAQFADEKPSKPSITSFRMPEPKVLSDERQNLQEKQESMEAVSEMLQSISDNLANAVPDKADGYSAKSLQEFDIRTAKIDGKSYEISGDTLHKVAEAATEEYYSNIERLMNNEINVEDVVGYTSKGKTSTATQADGTKVSLTGKLYNKDGTPRFDELVIAKIIRKSKEKAKSNAINKYSDEISGDTVAKNNTSKVETKVSSASTRKHFTSARSSGRKSSGNSKRSSSGGSAEFVRAIANAVTKRSQSRSIAALPDTVSKQAIQSAANAVVKNKGLPNTVKMINNPLFM